MNFHILINYDSIKVIVSNKTIIDLSCLTNAYFCLTDAYYRYSDKCKYIFPDECMRPI